MSNPSNQEIRSAVLESYRQRAQQALEGGAAPPSCCGSQAGSCAAPRSTDLGYSEEEIRAVPATADLGLGCGNPLAVADLAPGETVLDLGSGGGIDCFLAATKVGPEGQVIGVDMTPEMVALARQNAVDAGVANASFRLGEIEHLPVADSSVDVILSNCVINLVPDKRPVYREAFRALKPGGRLSISDVVARAPITDALRADLRLWATCASGACLVAELIEMLTEIGFEEVRIDLHEWSRDLIAEWSPVDGLEELITSASIEAVKPASAG